MNSNKIGANLRSPLSTCKNTFNFQNRWMNEWFTKCFFYIICTFFLHKLLFLFCDNFETSCFLARGFTDVCGVVFIPESENWQFFFPRLSVTPLSTLITCCTLSRAGLSGVERGTIAQIYPIEIHLILVSAMGPRINQWQSLFSWVKV